MGNASKKSIHINFPNEHNIIRDNYFSIVSQSLIHHKNILNHYQLNHKLIFKKNFKECNNASNKIRLGLDWKTYLMNFFKKQLSKGNEFYLDIINDMDEEKFGFEEKYLSLMFYIDYESTYIAKNKENNYKKYIKEVELDYEKQLKSRLSRNSSIDISLNNKRSRSSINLPNVENDENNEIKQENPIIEKKKLRREVKLLVKIIKRQIKKKDHPINIVIQIFEKQISSLILDHVHSFKNNPEAKELFIKNIEDFNNSIINNILKFASKIHTATKFFYSKVIHLDCFIEEKDELINIIMGILFNTGTIYFNMYYLFDLQYRKDIEEFKYKLNAIKNLTPKDIQIDDKFCLDENTDRLIEKLKKENRDKKNNDLNEDKSIFSFLYSKSKINSSIRKNKNDGYKSAIEIIKNKLKKFRSPYRKMLLISSISTEITECVDNYWAETDEIIPSSNYLQVTSDELLKIFIYIVVHAQNKDLIIHELFVQKFTFSLTKSSMFGYYNSTLDAAINYIQTNLLNDVKIGITEEFRSSIKGTLKLTHKIKIDYDISIPENTKLCDDSLDEDIVLVDGTGKEIRSENISSNNIYNMAVTYSEKGSGNRSNKMSLFFEKHK